MNGRLDAQLPSLTCKNSSTVDYLLATANTFENISAFHVLKFDSLYSDAHCPLSVNIKTMHANTSKTTHQPPIGTIPEVKLWDSNKSDLFTENINYDEISKINSFLDVLGTEQNVHIHNINETVRRIENLFISNSKASFGQKRIKPNSHRQNTTNKQWFNKECRDARNTYHNVRRLYNKYKTNHYKHLLKNVSNAYKKAISKNIKRHNNEKITKLRSMKRGQPRDFWKIINSVNSQPKTASTLSDLFDYFKNVNANIPEDTSNNLHQEDSYPRESNSTQHMNMDINKPITENEILTAVKNLKNNKGPGVDNILNEHIKSTIQIMLPIYTKLFNIIFDTGIVPESWSLGNILPIYKNKGDNKLPENYRPITLLSCFGKLFTAILNVRLTNYFEENEIIDSCQAGFRKGFSTTDNLFILQSLIEIAKTNKNKLYCTFIDFKQAFDTVWRDGLWTKLSNTNVNGKCFKFIKNMYHNIKSRVTTAEGTSAFFPCLTGVRQGENLSPLLFSIFLNDLKGFLHMHKAPGLTCNTNIDDHFLVYIKLFVLLFADDTVIFSNNCDDLQKTLNVFEKYCNEWKLTVNTSKTKIVIFSGGRAKQDHKFYFNGEQIEVLNEYKYLGVFLSSNGSYTKAKKHIIDQANNAMFSLLRKIRALNLPIDLQVELFNKTIKPILLYGCELWGTGNLESIERVQLKFLKQILNLKKSTPSFMVYGELGVYPLTLEIKTRIVSFWTKLQNEGENDITESMYKILFSLNEKGKLKSNWVDYVKHILCSNGYGNIWEAPNEFNQKWLVASLKQKLKDQYIQNWSSLVDQSSSGTNYRIFKNSFQMNTYFSYLNNRDSRILTAFRTRNHHLPVETGRWSSIALSERVCKYCQSEIGDEFHYILTCARFSEHRQKYIKPYYYRNPNTLKLNSLMNHSNKTVVKNLCIFVQIIMKTVKDFNQ